MDAGALGDEGVRELAALAKRLLGERDQLRLLAEYLPAVLYIDEVVEPRTGAYPTLYVGPQIESVLGISQKEWLENDDVWEVHMHPDDWPRASEEYDEYIGRGGVLVQEYRFVRPDDGRIVFVRDDCTMAVDPATGHRIILGVMFDITDQKKLEEQLRTAEAKNRALIDQIPGVVWLEPLSDNPEPPFVSAAVEHLFGVDRADWLASAWWERHVHPDDRERVLRTREAVVAEGVARRVEYRMTTAAGHEIWIEEVSQVVTSNGKPWLLQGLLDDVTARKQTEERLEFRASHDPLTGLANRPLFDESLELALARARRSNLEVAVLFVDVDGFKRVNDVYGHDAGDEVLRIIATRLTQCARESDVVARRGGDEFLVLLPDIEPTAIGSVDSPYRGVEVADHIVRRILGAMESPIELAVGTVTLSVSVGRCVYPWDASDAHTMMAVADASMYGAKQER